MTYKVVYEFKDLHDNEHIYVVNDVYPHEGINETDIPRERIKELSTKKNKIGKVLIKEINEIQKNKPE